MDDLKPYIDKAVSGAPLSQKDAAAAFKIMMQGGANDAQIAGFLIALRMRGETVDEIVGAATTMRQLSTKVDAPADAIDIVGTGGDAKGTYNISTCTAIVVAGAGIPVAKHGNRSISSKSGSADVLEALGVNLDASPKIISKSIRDANLGFMFAPAHHSAMRHVMPARKALATRTIFNLLGPLTNPAATTRQVVGVFDRAWVRPLAQVLDSLGVERALVVHGSDGMDEITTTGPTYTAALDAGKISEFDITPEMAGISKAHPKDLLGGSASENANAITDLLSGASGAFRDIVVLNAAAALITAGETQTWTDAAARAVHAIDSGAAKDKLAKLIRITNAPEPAAN